MTLPETHPVPSAVEAGSLLRLRVVDARSGLPIPRPMAAVDGGEAIAGSLDGSIDLRGLAPGERCLVLFKSGFESLQAKLPVSTRADDDSTAAVELRLEHGEGAVPIYFNSRSPRRKHAEPIERATIYGEFDCWNKERWPMAPLPGAAGVWVGRVELPVTSWATDYRFFTNGHLHEDDPDDAMAGLGVGFASHVHRRTRSQPELRFAKPEEGLVAKPGTLRCDLVFSPANGERSALDPASLSLDANGFPIAPLNLEIDAAARRVSFEVAFPDRGERALTAELRDQAGRVARAFLTLFVADADEPRRVPPAKWADTTPSKHPDAPAWLADAVIYQVHTRVFRSANGEAGCGTFRGLIEKLDYIADLGADTLQLMPLFDGPSAHGYVNTSFFRVDRAMGSNADFRDLVAAAKARGLRVLLDFSDTATQTCHPLFGRAALEPAHPMRPFLNWASEREYTSYTITRDTTNGPWPQFNFDEPRAREYMAEMMIHWIRAYGVDGFRLDSVERVKPFPSHGWWKVLRREVRAARPDAVLWGEVFENQETYFDNELDAAYDTKFNSALSKGLLEDDARLPMEAALKARAEDPTGARFIRFLSNHDTDRALSALKGDKAKLRQAFFLLLTLPGVPYLYYGDEIGLLGEGVGKGNTNRQQMPWGDGAGDESLRAFVRSLSRLRRSNAALRNAGGFDALPVKNAKGVFACRRALPGRLGENGAGSGERGDKRDRGERGDRGQGAEAFLLFANFGAKERVAKLEPAAAALLAGRSWRDALGSAGSPADENGSDRAIGAKANGAPVSSETLLQDGLKLAVRGWRVLKAV